jgi:hypothetical protein
MAQAHFEPTWAFIKRPAGYPVGPAVGKPELILQSRGNDKALYHRLSPYSNYHQGLLDWGDEPYYYIYPDQAKNFPNSAKKYDSRLFPLGSAIIDVQRTVKFLVSGRGVQFLAKQFLLQTGQAFNETRIYNPTSPIVAAGLTLTLGSARPQRMFDTSGGLTGIATTLLGSAGAAIFGPPKQNPVSGTAYASYSDALPDANKPFAAKGNLRAGTANRGQANLQAAWPGTTGNGGSTSGGFFSAVGNLAKSLFSNFIPATQQNVHYRSDEGAYGMMIASDFRFSTPEWGMGQEWVAGKAGNINIRKKGEYTTSPTKYYAQVQNGVIRFVTVSTKGSVTYSIPTVGAVGYSISPSGNDLKPGYRYGDSMGKDQSFEGSEMMVQYNFYQKQKFPTKDPESTKPDELKVKNQLKKVLDDIKAASVNAYTATADGVLLMNDSTTYDYDRIFQTKNKKQTPSQYKYGSLKAYQDSGARLVSIDISKGSDKSFKLPTAGQYDALNTLSVLDNTKATNSDLSGWSTWEPYKDDFIALFFYDVVNDKYIPFRASIKGLSESGNASWEELPFIGRADKVYSYGGFNRNASFTIKIVINSIKELAPTWQRINYMNTAYKPANYTKSTYVSSGNSRYDRFVVPPMFFLTLGDFYRDQPILIQSVVITVPDEAIWETQSEDNQEGGWNYLAGLIKSNGKIRYGQVPREVELAFSVTLLEKERAVVGGANFGHAPRTEEWGKYNTDIPNGKTPNKFNQNLLVDVINS